MMVALGEGKLMIYIGKDWGARLVRVCKLYRCPAASAL